MAFVDPLAAAREIMDDFAHSTGLSSERPPRRYLWTDAFAICNDLGLYGAIGAQRYRELALGLLDRIFEAAARSLEAVVRSEALQGADRRRAFRELGLAVGLQAASRLLDRVEGTEGGGRPEVSEEARSTFDDHLELVDRIQDYWMDPSHREAEGWSGHRAISRVMLATSLAPDGYLGR